MITKAKLTLLIAPLQLALAAPAMAYDELPSGLARLSPTEFADQISLLDGPLEPAIVLSTKNAYKRGRGIEGAHASDVHLEALIERKTGAVSWRVWHQLVYVGDPRNLTSVQYRTAGELRQSDALTIEHWLDGCPPTDGIGSCNQVTRVGFELPEHVVHEIAQSYSPGQRTPWQLRFEDSRGRDITGGLAPAEVAGLAQAVAEWRSTKTGSQRPAR